MDVFFSYASGDHDRIRPLVSKLQSHGWSVWWDQTILAGQRWDDVIAEALAEARCVVVAWTTASVVSDWVRIEANSGWERHILVPIVLESIEVPLAFRLTQTVSLVGWDGVADHTGLLDLINGVRGVLDRDTRAYPVSARRTERRALDAAIARNLPLLEPTNLIAMIRLASSHGLKAILEADEEHGLVPSDVASKIFELEFSVDAAGRLIPPHLLLRVTAPDFDPPMQEKAARINPYRDSLTLAFLLKPLVAGELLIQVEVYEGRDCLASRLLRSNGVASGRSVGPGSHMVVSLPLQVYVVIPTIADLNEQRERGRTARHKKAQPTEGSRRPSRRALMGFALLMGAVAAFGSLYTLSTGSRYEHRLPSVATSPSRDAQPPIPDPERPGPHGPPRPVLVVDGIPRSARVGQAFTVRAEAVNVGGPARSGSITLSFSGSPHLVLVGSDAGHGGEAIYEPGATVTRAEGGTTHVVAPIAEAYYGASWDYGKRHDLVVTVVPRVPGLMKIWVRATASLPQSEPLRFDGNQHFSTDDVETDQQGFPARVYSVEVD